MKTKRPPQGPFAANLRTLLDGHDRAELAARCGMSPRRLSRLASGEVRPCLEDLPKLARELGLAPEALAWCSTEELLRRIRPRPAGTHAS